MTLARARALRHTHTLTDREEKSRDLPRRSDVMMMMLLTQLQIAELPQTFVLHAARLWIWAHLLLHTITVPLSCRGRGRG